MTSKIIQYYRCDADSVLIIADSKTQLTIPNGVGDCVGKIRLMDFEGFRSYEKEHKELGFTVGFSWIQLKVKKELRVYNYDCYKRVEDLNNEDNYITLRGNKTYSFGYCSTTVIIIEW